MIKTLKAFFATRITYQVRELYISASMVNLAAAMVVIFEPIYLYKIGYSIEKILLFYLVVYVLYLIFIPFGAKFARRFGYEKAILFGTPPLAAYYVFLYLIAQSQWFALAAIAAFAVQKVFYWPGYHADFARFGQNKERGRELSNFIAISTVVSIIGPFAGGIIIATFGFKALFAAVTVVILASNIVLLSTPEKFKPVPFSYAGAFRRLFSKENRRNFFGFIGFADEFIDMVIWPIFIFTIIANFFSIGSIVALATLTTTVALLFVGRIVDGDKNERRSVLKLGTVFKSGVWLVRLLVRGPLGIFLSDALGRTAKNTVVVPMLAMTYDRANETSIMKTVVFFEMSLVVGKIIAMLGSLLMLYFVPDSFFAIFVFAALMTLLYGFVKFEPIKLENKS